MTCPSTRRVKIKRLYRMVERKRTNKKQYFDENRRPVVVGRTSERSDPTPLFESLCDLHVSQNNLFSSMSSCSRQAGGEQLETKQSCHVARWEITRDVEAMSQYMQRERFVSSLLYVMFFRQFIVCSTARVSWQPVGCCCRKRCWWPTRTASSSSRWI